MVDNSIVVTNKWGAQYNLILSLILALTNDAEYTCILICLKSNSLSFDQ